ncbi:MAG: MurT ligase domain-containing protein [Alicyclobacillus herbarius]|uniref:Mur ligase family protein n=1 Tax=Alicyclobacillus herbarius TaxID=122960 RepID=UPI0003FFBA89|nr:Mur ligase family protein [Alicyclobacillus herbarius]MCL6631558.1 MurT ligase domain-containing protein [Alicyclobacillus herbarius]
MLGIWIGKLLEFLLRLAGRRATSFPGKFALRVSPGILMKLGRQLERCIVVTGTNGKTTTTQLLAAMMRQEGPIITNAEGANMQQGLAAALIKHADWRGRLRAKTAVLEIDEATLPLVASCFPIRVAAVTNVFRDQLDRYGELDSTMQKIISGLADTEAVLVLNGDDPLARHIGLGHPGRVLYFGLDERHLSPQTREQMRDGAFCLECGERLAYDGFFYGQLGVYRCPNCDFFRPHPDFLARVEGAALQLKQAGQPDVTLRLPVRGLFNVYNALCAVAAARVCGLGTEHIQRGLDAFRAPLGRMQVFSTRPEAILNLIKNPTGCDSVLQAICQDAQPKVVCIAINDLAADGRDVSWLWDADFEWLAESGQAVHIVTTGLRAEDMALRLKYAGYPTVQMHVQPNLNLAVDMSLALAEEHGPVPVYVLSTYTALYPMAECLERKVNAYAHETAYRTSVS